MGLDIFSSSLISQSSPRIMLRLSYLLLSPFLLQFPLTFRPNRASVLGVVIDTQTGCRSFHLLHQSQKSISLGAFQVRKTIRIGCHVRRHGGG
ncbi:hypothetical protein OIU84_029568 [Salix udensis]|uniref:Uncharacterized protein n=1 Tax=Salix udensis TaxID=889485 RepID=A0AAD6P7Y5_9ROSI|nr:hypothetical protein OIU84_029568 [Salix udensis]KAJ6419487.1 hypothetical protein OIU84_029568 [Salix udensis]KAJ6419488.1 hypothetical protein OIU84_029568 [Salix udensis]KAJ6419489.1 hypothetical protein OIU84_029568 [Salix udensis]